MKLDVQVLRYMEAEEFRLLHGVEQGMRNHEYVPKHLIAQLAGLRRGGIHKALSQLVRNKLLGYDNKKADGYRLTTSGYDFLALRTFNRRDTLVSLGNQIGVGKESDIYIVANSEGEQLALKLHRLGRTCFRTIKNKRDYFQGRKHVSWLYLAHLAAVKEFAYMQVLHEHGFPVPVPVDVNRNCIVMQLLDATPMNSVTKIIEPGKTYNELMEIIVRLANHGLIHCDFNEFNLMVTDAGKVTMIDFPQMISIDHANAEYYFDRDVECICVFFERRFGYTSSRRPKFSDVTRNQKNLDQKVSASGYTKELQKEFDELNTVVQSHENPGGAVEGGTDSDEESSDDEDEDNDDLVSQGASSGGRRWGRGTMKRGAVGAQSTPSTLNEVGTRGDSASVNRPFGDGGMAQRAADEAIVAAEKQAEIFAANRAAAAEAEAKAASGEGADVPTLDGTIKEDDATGEGEGEVKGEVPAAAEAEAEAVVAEAVDAAGDDATAAVSTDLGGLALTGGQAGADADADADTEEPVSAAAAAKEAYTANAAKEAEAAEAAGAKEDEWQYGDDILDVGTENRSSRAFRDPTPSVTVADKAEAKYRERAAKPSLDEEAIRRKVRNALANKNKMKQIHKTKTQTKFKSSSKRNNKDTIKQDAFCL